MPDPKNNFGDRFHTRGTSRPVGSFTRGPNISHGPLIVPVLDVDTKGMPVRIQVNPCMVLRLERCQGSLVCGFSFHGFAATSYQQVSQMRSSPSRLMICKQSLSMNECLSGIRFIRSMSRSVSSVLCSKMVAASSPLPQAIDLQPTGSKRYIGGRAPNRCHHHSPAL